MTPAGSPMVAVWISGALEEDRSGLQLHAPLGGPLLVSTVLHEAAHNLGPASGYTVDGKTDEQAFGGELATMRARLSTLEQQQQPGACAPASVSTPAWP